MKLSHWEKLFENKIAQIASSDDPAHDLLHFKRVVNLAKKIAAQESADLNVVVPAAWLHDFVIVPKDSSLRSKASKLSAEAAIKYLSELKYPERYLEGISHAIEGHSFSAKVEVFTTEAKVVQDADRLDGLGAIGLARCFATAGVLKRPFYEEHDPFCKVRTPDDLKYTIDHFFHKLFNTAKTLKTEAGRLEGQRRVLIMREYLDHLSLEITP